MNRFNSLNEWLSWQESLHPQPIDLGLERVQRVFRKLLPNYKTQKKPVTITVAGTNGKGSTVAYLQEFYFASGHKVGAYTSPHILRYNERIKINGKSVSDELICAAFEQIDKAKLKTQYTLWSKLIDHRKLLPQDHCQFLAQFDTKCPSYNSYAYNLALQLKLFQPKDYINEIKTYFNKYPLLQHLRIS